MNEIQTFNFKENVVRTLVGQDGGPWFVAKDVAEVLGYTNPPKAVRDHCKAAERMTVTNRSGQKGGAQFITIIPERDVYRLIMRSRLPQADVFEEWVVGTVLPAIRKTGGYIVGEEECESEDELIARAYGVLMKKIEQLGKKVEDQRIQLEENLTVDGYRGFYKHSYWSHSYKTKIGKLATKICVENGWVISKQKTKVRNRHGDLKETAVNLYPIRALDAALQKLESQGIPSV